jgi:hypothetical protein
MTLADDRVDDADGGTGFLRVSQAEADDDDALVHANLWRG